MTSRRSVLKMMALATAGAMLGQGRLALAAPRFLSQRPPLAKRKFVSPAVERLMARVKAKIADPELAWMFENCFANTLDTTVQVGNLRGKPDTFIVTGDIDAMWLRDSSAQVWPYVSLAAHDEPLQRLFRGLIRRHAYWQATGDKRPFDDDWRDAMRKVLATFREQQRKHGPGSYHFQRRSEVPTESQFLGGYGNPARPVGLIHSMFRPSDDACLYPLFIPGNLFALSVLRQLAQMTQALFDDRGFAAECHTLADEIEQALQLHGIIRDEPGGEVWAYEVDGYGNQLFIDDANAPGLSSLAYLGCCPSDDARYRRTRALAWSERNPYFFSGRAAQGIGGPHEGLRMIWPMSIIMRALTSTNSGEIRQCLQWLKTTHAGTGFMHEAFDQDDPTHFTRAWFAWANTLFGELMVQIADRQPELLRRS
ncbi:glycoside hydrolase family 125 protein [Dyella silvatica]|uniref:glycoside hydrolase family 125 protein n=1 Tax=Dyella silvatica TaxID=2992128 RepID=UPI0022575380|nr:glycoside hydrolase family 125 protein [Dyella silvatica]